MAAYLAVVGSFGLHSAFGAFEFVPSVMLILHDLAYLDVTLASRRPSSGMVAFQFRIGTALSWYSDTRIEGAKVIFAILTLIFTLVKAYTIRYVASEGGMLAFTGPVLAQLILMVAMSSAETR